MPLMSGDYIDSISLDLALRHHRRAAIDDSLRTLLGLRPGVILADLEFLGDLQPREVQPLQIEACDLGPQQQMMVGEDGAGQVSQATATGPTLVALAARLGVVTSVLDDRIRRTSRTGRAVGPTHGPDRVIAIGVVEEILDDELQVTRGA